MEVYNGDGQYYMFNRTEAEEPFPISTSIVSSASSCVSYRTGPISFISSVVLSYLNNGLTSIQFSWKRHYNVW